jgi:hypothetical protein
MRIIYKLSMQALAVFICLVVLPVVVTLEAVTLWHALR